MGKPPDKSLGVRLEIFATSLGVKVSLNFRHYLPKRLDLEDTYVNDVDKPLSISRVLRFGFICIHSYF